MKTALITGAAQGLGLVTATLLARQGYHVILADLQDLESQAKGLRATGASVATASGDVASESYASKLAASIQRDHGALDVLVNNAGISLICPAEETTAEQWQKVMAVNLLGPFLLCKYLGAQMLPSPMTWRKPLFSRGQRKKRVCEWGDADRARGKPRPSGRGRIAPTAKLS